MDGNILSKRQNLYGKIIVLPFRVLFIMTTSVYLAAIFITTLFFFIAPENNREIMELITKYPAIFIVTVVVYFIYFLITIPTKKIKKSFRIGTKIKIFSRQTYSKTYKTGTRTTILQGGVPVSSYDNYNTDYYKTTVEIKATVKKVKRRGLVLELGGETKKIGYVDMFTGSNVIVVDTY